MGDSSLSAAAFVPASDDHILRISEVLAKTGLNRTALYDQQAAGKFPQSFSLGGRSVGWLNSEVCAWIKQRAASRGTAQPSQVESSQVTPERVA